MTGRVLNIVLIITSLAGYLEWSGNSHAFLFEAEREFFTNLFIDPVSAIHPFTLLPLAGQIILLFTLFQKKPSRAWTYIAIADLGILLGFMFLIGIISGNFKILISTIPFIVTVIFTIRYHKNQT